ncbi:MAG: tRNA (adenosine(37)-N6)-threonylcarbamoyltransferase complex dimerization subunit type 1 TsaB [Anaerolineales bacterium]
MNILAIDTSTRASGIALYDGLNVRYECVWHSAEFHSVELAPGIKQALTSAGMKLAELQAIAVAIGPGSYTGLRIGLALAKGLAFAQGLKIIAVPTLDVLAAGQPMQDLPMAAVLQAGRARLAVGWYKVKKEIWSADGQPRLIAVEELADLIKKPTWICGELNEEERRVLGRKHKNAQMAPPAWNVRRPALLAELAWTRLEAGKADEARGLAPTYLQAAEAAA